MLLLEATGAREGVMGLMTRTGGGGAREPKGDGLTTVPGAGSGGSAFTTLTTFTTTPGFRTTHLEAGSLGDRRTEQIVWGGVGTTSLGGTSLTGGFGVGLGRTALA